MVIVEMTEADAPDGIKRVIGWARAVILRDLHDAGVVGWLAGGSVRAKIAGERINDLDLFFADYDHAEAASKWLRKEGCEQLWKGENCTRFKRGKHFVDVVTNLYEDDPAKCIANFDFTVSAFAIKDDKLYYHKNSFIDLAGRRLSIVRLPEPLATLNRMRKYQERGYRGCQGTVLTIAQEIAMLDPAELGEMSMYVD